MFRDTFQEEKAKAIQDGNLAQVHGTQQLLDLLDRLEAEKNGFVDPEKPKAVVLSKTAQFYPESGVVLLDQVPVELTYAEMNFLLCLATKQGSVCDKDTLAIKTGWNKHRLTNLVGILKKKLAKDPELVKRIKSDNNGGYVLWAEVPTR